MFLTSLDFIIEDALLSYLSPELLHPVAYWDQSVRSLPSQDFDPASAFRAGVG